MLNKETQEKLKGFGFNVESLIEAVKAEEEKGLEVPKLFTEDQTNTLSTNMRREGFEDGKKAMGEIMVKDLKSKHQIEFDGKDIDTFMTKFKEKHSTGDDSQFKADLESLQAKYRTDIAARDQLIKAKESELFQISMNGSIQKHWDKETLIPKDKLLVLFNNEYSLDVQDGKTVVKRDGEILKDEMKSPLSLEAVSKSFYEPYIKKEGMGGGNEGGGGSSREFKTFDEMSQYYRAKGENPNDHLDEVKTEK